MSVFLVQNVNPEDIVRMKHNADLLLEQDERAWDEPVQEVVEENQILPSETS